MALLALLDAGPTHGFDLKHRYDTLLGQERELKFGQVYATLQRLQRDGLATEVGIKPGDGPDRRLYAITDRGVSELDHWLETPEVAGTRPAEVFTRVILALACGRPAAQVLDAHRRVYLDRMRSLTARRHAGDAIDRLAGDYEIAHLEADLHWIEVASSRLTELAARMGAPTSGASTQGADA
jgi:DNA-binding PadR family transcriptional regulator